MRHASDYVPGGATGRTVKAGEWWALDRSGMGHFIEGVGDGVVTTACGLMRPRGKLRPAPSVMKCRKCDRIDAAR